MIDPSSTVQMANLFGIDNDILILLAALLLFGRRLPDVGRNIGRGIVEFKKGLQGLEEDIDQAGAAQTRNAAPTVSQLPSPPSSQPAQPAAPTTTAAAISAGYKFDPYTGKPLNAAEQEPAAARSSSDNLGA